MHSGLFGRRQLRTPPNDPAMPDWCVRRPRACSGLGPGPPGLGGLATSGRQAIVAWASWGWSGRTKARLGEFGVCSDAHDLPRSHRRAPGYSARTPTACRPDASRHRPCPGIGDHSCLLFGDEFRAHHLRHRRIAAQLRIQAGMGDDDRPVETFSAASVVCILAWATSMRMPSRLHSLMTDAPNGVTPP